MCSLEILASWEFVQCEMELRIRRLGWYQSWASRTRVHACVVAMLFGALVFEPAEMRPCAEEGLSQFASPWAERIQDDVRAAIEVMPDDRDLLLRVADRPWLLIEDKVKKYPRISFATTIAPPGPLRGVSGHGAPGGLDPPPDPVAPYACSWTKGEGAQ
jgi:hypothetical protein